MAVEIIPSITATTPATLRRYASVAQKLSPVVHLDVMDGKFVSTTSPSLVTMRSVVWKKQVELHAMVRSARAFVSLLNVVHPKRVYIPVEIGREVQVCLELLKSRKIEAGLSINPGTRLSVLKKYVPEVKTVLVLGIHPGRYHAPFIHKTKNRVRLIHRTWPKLTIACDGGMNAETIPAIIKAGATRITIGSAVMLSPDPVAAWKSLRSLTK